MAAPDQIQIQRSWTSRVKVHSLLSVVSSKPIPPGKIHQLSLLDQAMEPHTLHLVFYYSSNPFLGGAVPTDADSLRVSLSRLLDDYPVATGRLTRGSDGGWMVKCNDAGVRMVQAAVGATLDEWLKTADVAEERDLTVWEEMPMDPTFWSPFRIQLNDFKCGGLAIGVSCTHMHADPTSATLLIKSWAETHRRLPLSHSPLFHVLPPSSSSSSFTPSSSFRLSPLPTTPTKMATITIKFSAGAIQRCLSQVQSQQHYPAVTSPFDILAALFWSRIARLMQEQYRSSPRRTLSVCLDMRRSNSTVPYAYFGNALHFSELELSVDSLSNDGLGALSDRIRRHVEGIKGDDFGSVTQWLEDHHGKELREGRSFRVYAPRLTCISMEHMVDAEGQGLMYTADFYKDGGNRPAHVSYRLGNVEGEGLVIVMPSAEGGQARNVTAVLPEDIIDDLCKDPVIEDLKPTMIISGNRNSS